MATSLPRARLVQLIATLLSKQGDKMVAEVEKRISNGEGLEIKGIKVDTGVLLDALEEHSNAAAKPSEAGEASAASSSSTAAGSDAKAEPKSSARWTPAGAGSSRWTPGTPSASLLTNKALVECEQAEPFTRSVELVAPADSWATVFPRPDVLEKPLPQRVTSGEPFEVVARYLSQRDGRVYLRLKAETGWVCTRACDDIAEVVLAALAGEQPLEPEKFRTWPLASPASSALPKLEQAEEAENMEKVPEAGAQASIPEADEEDDNDASEQQDDELSTDVEDDEGSADDDEELGGDETEQTADEPLNRSPGASSPGRARRVVKKFRVVAGRCAVIKKPGAASLNANGQKMLQKGETFLADGVYFMPSEQRAYLRLTRGLGWVCERSKQDLWRLGVVKVITRKTPISKKRAKAVAFRGGDTGGATHLRKDDLMKNSQGKIVSKRASEAAKKRSNDSIGKWTEAVKRARVDLNVTGFSAVKKGTPLYEKAQEHFAALKAEGK